MKRIQSYVTLVCLLVASLGAEPAPVAATDADALLSAAKAAPDAKDALKLVERAAELAPERSDLQAELGHALARRIEEVNFMQKAALAGRMLKAYRRAVELDPTNLGGWIGLAAYYTNAPAIAGGSLDEARKAAAEVEKLSPVQGRLAHARIAEKSGETQAAYDIYAELAASRPDNASLQDKLGELSEKLGRVDEARAFYEKALAIDPEREHAKKALAKLGDA